MKTLALFSILLCAMMTGGAKNDYIALEYTGDADKPMPVIYISKKLIPHSEQVVTIEYDDLPENYIVSDQEFSQIKEAIVSTKRKPFEDKDYNGFKITVRQNDSKESSFITRKVSDSFLLKSINYLKGNNKNKELISRLNTLRTMNAFHDSVRH